MASKRKNKTPERFSKRKQSSISSISDYASNGHDFGGNNGVTCGETGLSKNRPKSFENKSVSHSVENKIYAQIKIERVVLTELYLKDDNHGPVIGELKFKLDEKYHDKCCSTLLTEKEKSLKSSLCLIVQKENPNGDFSSEVSVVSTQGNHQNGENCMCCTRTILIGSLSSSAIITNLEYLTKKQKIKLILCKETTDGNLLKILIELVIKQQDEMIDLNYLNDIPNDKIIQKHMKQLVKYFFQFLDVENVSSDYESRYTYEKIQFLYDYIMKYHGEKSDFVISTPEQNEDSGISLDNGSFHQKEDVISPGDIIKNVEEAESNISSNDDQSSDTFDQMDLDEFIYKKENDFNHDSLMPSLRKYQQLAVEWMIKKENIDEYEAENADAHTLWTKLQTIDGKVIYYNRYSGRFVSKMKVKPLPRGGILADEMGLGKTVEVLALILNNPKKQRFVLGDCLDKDIKDNKEEDCCNEKSNKTLISCCYHCNEHFFGECRTEKCSICDSVFHFDCAGTKGRVLNEYLCFECSSNETFETHCTLIVSPETIVNQWIEEIERHVKPGALKYLLYQGVAKDGFIQPTVLAEYDVIITTYNTLRADFYHVQAEEAKLRSMRHQKKYANVPSPLTSLHFWRICLDEAQMVQSTTTRTAEMAIRIQAVHRWCVTGTPVQKGLEDIYGMLLFVGVFPYCIKFWWKKLLYEPLIRGNNKPLFELLARVMWRTEKKNVLDQINLPKQTEKVTRLRFSPVEKHFYQKQEEVCMANAMKEIHKWSETETMLSALDKSSLHKLLAPLLRLRLACCHPHVVRGGILTLQKTHLTMDKLLERLTAKAKVECIEAHRQLMCAMNGLAAMDIIEYKFSDAVNKYREAMQSWSAHKDIFKTDILQKLHTIKNLADMLSQYPNCPRALSDDQLHEEAEELKKEYSKKAEMKLSSAKEMLETMQNNLQKSKESVDWKNPWWRKVLSHFKDASEKSADEIVNKINIELESQKITTDSIRNKFSTIDGLLYIMSSRIDSVMELHETLLQKLETINCEPSKEIILKTAECCLRPIEGSNAPRCSFCMVDDLFTEYENKIFSHRGKKEIQNENDETKKVGGLRAVTELDIVLKLLLSIARQNYFDSELKDQGKLHIEYMDLLKQEFKCLRQLWFALHQRISSFDEIEMSGIRLRLRYSGEETNEKYVIEPFQIRVQRWKLDGDQMIAENELRRKKGQLFYLKNLEKAKNTENGSNPDTCPICTKVLGFDWAVFPCGHCFCCDCVYVLERQQSGRMSSIHMIQRGVKIKCAICRAFTLIEDISFVMMDEDRPDDNIDVNVKGSYSVKIQAVVRRILEISQKDADGKIIVFSSWQDVLDIISKALFENDIIFRNGSKSRKAFQVGLADFKKLDSVKVILLPLKSGAKGLNIIEATHVILVEPTLNPSNEHQAIGRVHRIGQTKPTFVHRFFVRETVEERICHLLQTKSSDSFASEQTNVSLTIADVSNLIISKENSTE